MNLRFARLIHVAVCTFFVAGIVSARGKDVTITKDDQMETLDCSGNAVTIKGSDNKISLKGECSKLTVSGDDNLITALAIKDISISGDDNTVTVDTVAKISTTGDDNNIAWEKGAAGKAPQISAKGTDNKIRQTSQ